jgi:hypothetical protein
MLLNRPGPLLLKIDIIGQAVATKGRVAGWSDIGLVSRRGEALGDIFAEAIPVAGGRTVVSVAIFERYPEHLCAMLERTKEQVIMNELRVQPRFRLDTGLF